MSSEDNIEENCRIIRKHGRITCNCGWATKFGYGVATTLAIFEAKRFFMLILEIFAEWQVIRFAGGLQPVIFTLADVCVGFPAALMTVRTIRTQKVPRCYTRTKRALRCLLLMIAVCAVMNAATLVSIGYQISVRRETLINVFNVSMHLYIGTASCKYAIDEIQFIFQCCGHSSYVDWFLFDWQGVDYASREEMANQPAISDERYRDHSVPYSCCNLHAMEPCIHSEIDDENVKTINTNGCAEIISPVLLRIVIVAYVMTSTLMATQILLFFVIAEIIRKLRPEICSLYYYPNACFKESSSASLEVSSSETERRNSSTSPSHWESRSSRATTKNTRRRQKKIKRSNRTRYDGNKESSRESTNSSSPVCVSSPARHPQDRQNAKREAARIKPSTHVEHTISVRHLCENGTR